LQRLQAPRNKEEGIAEFKAPTDQPMTQAVLNESAWIWFGAGLGIAFILSMAFLVLQFFAEEPDPGWIGLMFLLTMIFFLIAFSFLVAATTPGFEIKIAVSVVDGLVLIGSKLLAPHFLKYLAEEPIDTGTRTTNKQKERTSK
jgi:hypothetical protein